MLDNNIKASNFGLLVASSGSNTCASERPLRPGVTNRASAKVLSVCPNVVGLSVLFGSRSYQVTACWPFILGVC